MNTEIEKNPKETTLLFNGMSYSIIKERRNGTRIYSSQDKNSYLRIGPDIEIQEELRFHRQLIEQGYPVPKILEDGLGSDGERYYIESSAGTENFGMLFQEDCKDGEEIREETFQSFFKIVKRYIEAQSKEKSSQKNWESVFLATHFDLLITELPDKEEMIMSLWEKVKIDLANTAFVLCHGDFNAHNIMSQGVIDFETTFEGPQGYDLVSATASIHWFPREGDSEIFGKYFFTQDQIERLIALLPDVKKQFDALFILRSVWAVVNMDKFPKLQTWRYKKFEEVTKHYMRGDSIYEWLLITE